MDTIRLLDLSDAVKAEIEAEIAKVKQWQEERKEKPRYERPKAA